MASIDASGYAKATAAMAAGVERLGRGMASLGSSITAADNKAKADQDSLELAHANSQYSIAKLDTAAGASPSGGSSAGGTAAASDPYSPSEEVDTAPVTGGATSIPAASSSPDVSGAAPAAPDQSLPQQEVHAPTSYARPLSANPGIEEKANAFRAQRDQFAQGITDPLVRQKWVLNSEDDVERYRLGLMKQARSSERDNQITYARANQSAVISRAIETGDEGARAAGIRGQIDVVDALVANKFMTAQQGQAWKSQFRNDYGTAIGLASERKGPDAVNKTISELEQASFNAGAAQPQQKDRRSDLNGLGDLSGKYESRGDYGAGGKDNIGWAYGKYQFNSRGSLNNFLSDNPAIAKKFEGINPESQAFANKWRQVNNEMGPDFAQAQQESFLKHAQPSLGKAESLGFKLDDRGVMESVLSGSIQHGKWQRVLASAASTKGFADMSPQDQIKTLYQARADYVSNLGTIDDSTRAGVLDRYRSEIKDALKLAGQPANAVGTKVASADMSFAPSDGSALPGGQKTAVMADQPTGVASPGDLGQTPGVQTGQPFQVAQAQRHPTIYDAMDPLHRERLLKQMYGVRDAMTLDESRALELAKKKALAASDNREQEYLKDIYSDNPKLTARDVVNDPLLNREAKERIPGIINRADKPDPLSKISNETSMDLLDRMRRPDGDASKLTTLEPVYDAYINGKLNRTDLGFLRKEFSDMRTPEGESLANRKKDFLDSIKPSIDKSNPLMGVMDASGKQQLYQFNIDLERKMQQYRADGKNPYDLLDPSKPDYMGKSEAVAPYQKTLQQSIQDQVKNITGVPGAGSKVQSPSPPVLPRKPGESLADWEKRKTGGP